MKKNKSEMLCSPRFELVCLRLSIHTTTHTRTQTQKHTNTPLSLLPYMSRSPSTRIREVLLGVDNNAVGIIANERMAKIAMFTT